MHRSRGTAVALAVAALVAGCGGPSADPGGEASTPGAPPSTRAPARPAPDGPSPSPSATPAPSPPDAPAPPPPAAGDPQDGTVEAAVRDLAQHLGIAPGEVTVARVEEVTWSDGSLGCPEPGRLYTQAVVPGTLVLLEAGGSTFRYHASASRAPFRCESRDVPPVAGD